MLKKRLIDNKWIYGYLWYSEGSIYKIMLIKQDIVNKSTTVLINDNIGKS
jgi:hypothetical protein